MKQISSFLFALLIALPATAGDLAALLKKGEIVVGVKTDDRPFGYLDGQGRHAGLEPDLARDIAERLGLKVRFETVTAADRFDKLNAGQIDLIIATISDLPERRRQVRLVDPDYYASGINALVRADLELADWYALDGRRVCGIENAFYNNRISNDFGAEMSTFGTSGAAVAALEAGECDAFVFDSTFIAAHLANRSDDAFEMPFRTLDRQPWGIAVRRDSEQLALFVSGVVVDWHLSGQLREIERKHDLRYSDFAIDAQETLRKLNPGVHD